MRKPTSNSQARCRQVQPVVRTLPEGLTALHRGFRHKVFWGFRDGATTIRLRRKYSLTQKVVEEIIREHMRPNSKLCRPADSEARAQKEQSK